MPISRRLMDDAEDNCQPEKGAEGPPAHFCRGDEADRIVTALAYLETSAGADGSAYWKDDSHCQKAHLTKWAENLGLCLESDSLLPQLIRGGQEHDVIPGEERYIKVTRNGVFGLTPGIELALVSSSQDARRFHLWEASPFRYLERLRLQNQITPDLNRLEGIIAQEDDLSIVISQPTFEIVPVSEPEIDSWFESLGFRKLTSAAYYRANDNLGIFDAHDKNVIRAGGTLVPFDVIPCHPQNGFLEFIQETLSAGHSLKAVRTTRTGNRT